MSVDLTAGVDNIAIKVSLCIFTSTMAGGQADGSAAPRTFYFIYVCALPPVYNSCLLLFPSVHFYKCPFLLVRS